MTPNAINAIFKYFSFALLFTIESRFDVQGVEYRAKNVSGTEIQSRADPFGKPTIGAE